MRTFTQDELDCIRRCYPVRGWHAVREQYPHLCATEIMAQAREMGLGRRYVISDGERVDPNAPRLYRPSVYEGVWRPQEGPPRRPGSDDYKGWPSLKP